MDQSFLSVLVKACYGHALIVLLTRYDCKNIISLDSYGLGVVFMTREIPRTEMAASAVLRRTLVVINSRRRYVESMF